MTHIAPASPSVSDGKPSTFPSIAASVSITASVESEHHDPGTSHDHIANSPTTDKYGRKITHAHDHLTSVRSFNNILYNEDDIGLREGSVVYFSASIFVKELFYQTFHFLALPIVYFFDGGMESAVAHGMVPWKKLSLSLAGNIIWVSWVFINVFWILNNYEPMWTIEIMVLNATFSYRVLTCALRYSYLTSNERLFYFGWYNKNHNFDMGGARTGSSGRSKVSNGIGIGTSGLGRARDDAVYKRQSMVKRSYACDCNAAKDVRHTMLFYGWFVYRESTIEYQQRNAKLRLNWDSQSKSDKIIRVLNKKFNQIYELDIDLFIKCLIDKTSYFQHKKMSKKIILFLQISAASICGLNCFNTWVVSYGKVAIWKLRFT